MNNDIFKLREEFESYFNFQSFEKRYKDIINEVKKGKKTKSKRKKITLKEERKQLYILREAAINFANLVFERKDSILERGGDFIEKLIEVFREKMENKEVGKKKMENKEVALLLSVCDFYPCGKTI